MKATTHKGLEVELFFFEQDPNDQSGLNQGWVCNRVEAQVGSEVVGYLKIEWVPSETWDSCVPTIWHWWDGTQWPAQRGDWKGVWLKAHFRCGVIPASLKGVLESTYRLTRGMAPEDVETLHRDLRNLKKRVSQRSYDSPWRDLTTFKRNHMDRPKVAYVRTMAPSPWEQGVDWRRNGIATLLYNEGAKWMARRGLPLWASTLQQPEAAAVWEAMAAAGHPLYKRPVPWAPGETVYVLDYRV